MCLEAGQHGEPFPPSDTVAIPMAVTSKSTFFLPATPPLSQCTLGTAGTPSRAPHCQVSLVKVQEGEGSGCACNLPSLPLTRSRHPGQGTRPCSTASGFLNHGCPLPEEPKWHHSLGYGSTPASLNLFPHLCKQWLTKMSPLSQAGWCHLFLGMRGLLIRDTRFTAHMCFLPSARKTKTA